MSRPVSALPNLGPRSVESFARAGIHSAEELVALGADAAYRRLLAAGTRPHFIGYWALVLAVQGRPWTDLDPAEKPGLRRRFDALKAEARREAAPESALDAILDRFGVGPARQPTSSRPAKK
jgi:DNA transformation protein and related proteins